MTRTVEIQAVMDKPDQEVEVDKFPVRESWVNRMMYRINQGGLLSWRERLTATTMLGVGGGIMGTLFISLPLYFINKEVGVTSMLPAFLICTPVSALLGFRMERLRVAEAKRTSQRKLPLAS